jgi:hypothetical protein
MLCAGDRKGTIIMSTIPNVPAAATNAADPSTTPTDPSPAPGTPDTSTLPSVADQILAHLVQMENLVPNLRPHDIRKIRQVSSSAKFAHLLIAPTINAVLSVPSVPQGIFNVERGRRALVLRDLLKPLAVRIRALADNIDYGVDDDLAAGGEESLQTYHWAKRAESGPNGPALRPYLDEMKRVVRKILNRTTKKAGSTTTPDTPPATPPTTPPPNAQGFMSIRSPQPEPDDSWMPKSIYELAELAKATE